ncbi:MAG: hypothetical protein K1V87_04675 [Muribaculum sp.]
MAKDIPWKKIFDDYDIYSHDFEASPYILTADDIKKAVGGFQSTSDREVRTLCKQDTRNSRPTVFKENGLFILPKKNGSYYILKGEGYVELPKIETPIEDYIKKLSFDLESSLVGDSEMQFVDFAYANSLIRTFMNDESLVLTIRGRKYTPSFSFKVGNHYLSVEGVQTEVDAGYEGKNSIVLVEAKNSRAKDTIIRQLYYPYRQWSINTTKPVKTLFFEKTIIKGENIFNLWLFEFTDEQDYNSIKLIRSGRFRIV